MNLIFDFFINYHVFKFIDNHSGFFTFFVTLLTFGALVWYAWETRRLVTRTTESLIYTKEKEKVDRTLDIIDRFKKVEDSIKFLYDKHYEAHDEGEGFLNVKKGEIYLKIDSVLSLLDMISYLYFENKFDNKIFKDFFSSEFVDFVNNLTEELSDFLKLNRNLKRNNDYNNYLRLCLKLEEEFNFFGKSLLEDINDLINGKVIASLKSLKGYV